MSTGAHSKPVVRITDAGGIIEIAPYLMGFTPRQSLVVVGLQGPTFGRILVTARIDYTDADPGALQQLMDALHRGGATHLVVAIYLDEVVGDPRLDVGLAAVTRELTDLCFASAKGLVDVLVATGERFWSMLCENQSCCPAEGRRRIGGSVEAIGAGLAPPCADRDEMLRVLDPVVSSGDSLEPWLEVAENVLQRAAGDLQAMTDWRTEAMGALRALAGRPGGDLEVEQLARVAVALTDLEVRDEAWMIIDAREDLHEQLAALALQVARRAPGPYAAAGYLLYGWHCWRQGWGALATEAAERALAVTGGNYGAASLLATAMEQGLSPRLIPTLRRPPAEEARL